MTVDGGGGGSRTPVRRLFTPGYYVRFRSFRSRPRGPRPAGFPSDHPGLGFALPPPGRGILGYPVRATPFRLHGQSAVGRTRRVRPRRRSYSRWRLWVPAFYEVRGASARNPGASTSPSKPFRPRKFKIPCFPGQGKPPSQAPNRPALPQDSGRRRVRTPSGTGPTSRDIGRRKEERSLSGIAGLRPAGVTSLPPVAVLRPAPRGALDVAFGIPGGDVLPLVVQFLAAGQPDSHLHAGALQVEP